MEDNTEIWMQSLVNLSQFDFEQYRDRAVDWRSIHIALCTVSESKGNYVMKFIQPTFFKHLHALLGI